MTKPLLTLCMIVKDEAHGIAKTLRSAKPWIDRWCILDTGSTDGTIDVIESEMVGRAGLLMSETFQDFAITRNSLLNLACTMPEADRGEFLLLLDADDVLEGGEALRGFLDLPYVRSFSGPGLPSRDAFYLRMSEGACEWRSARVVRASAVGAQRALAEPVMCARCGHWRKDHENKGHGGSDACNATVGGGAIDEGPVCECAAFVWPMVEGWHYVGAVHEVLVHPSGRVPTITILGVSIRHERGPVSAEKLRARLERDRLLLEAEVYNDPKNARAWFYLGQTLKRKGGEEDAARVAFQARIRLGGWREEVFESMLERARLATGDQRVIELLAAHAFSPHRAEPLLELADYFRAKGQHGPAFTFARRAWELPYPEGDTLFVDRECYTWKAADRCAISAWYLGEWEIGERAARLAMLYGPEAERERLARNLRFYEERKAAR